jgi:hypothetical protein
MELTPSDTSGSEAKSTRLSRGELALCLTISLAVFFLYQGSFWRHRWQIDASIWYSYLVIPPVVTVVLARSRKLTLRELALGTLEVTCWKFGATYLIAQTVWMFSPPPPRPVATPVPVQDAPIAESSGRVSVPPDQTGSLAGSVTDTAGTPITGAVVFIESGLEGFAFAALHTDASFSVRSGAIEPSLSVAELHEQLRARSSDGKLHTLIARQGDYDLFNLPLQSSGAFSAAELRRGQGIATLHCAVHEHSGEVAQLVVVAHPFHTTLTETGRFAWSGIPAARITVTALHADGRVARV